MFSCVHPAIILPLSLPHRAHVHVSTYPCMRHHTDGFISSMDQHIFLHIHFLPRVTFQDMRVLSASKRPRVRAPNWTESSNSPLKMISMPTGETMVDFGRYTPTAPPVGRDVVEPDIGGFVGHQVRHTGFINLLPLALRTRTS